MNMLKTLIIASVFLALPACGFTPAHAPNAFGGSGIGLQNISVKMSQNDKINFLLAQSLRDRIGNNNNAGYVLSIEPEITRSGLGVSGQDIASRYDLAMSAKFVLRDKSGNVIYSDEVSAVSTYGAPLDPYGSHAANENAKRQLAREAADRIIARLAGFAAKAQK